MRMTRRRRLLAGAMLTTIPAAIPAGQALAATAATPPAVPAQVNAHRIAFDHQVVVHGSAAAGHRLALEDLPAGSSSWQTLATTTVGPNGHYRLSARLRRSGDVRVLDTTDASTSVPLALAREASAPVQHVDVNAAVQVTARGHGGLDGQSLSVSGRLLSEVGGRRVELQSRNGSSWTTLASTRTGRHGGFTLRFPASPGTHSLRIHFAGDAYNGRVDAGAGTVTGFEQTVASWYDDAGTTGCGFHATYGVANKSLPCGTRVTFSYGGRTVVATVDDRGPYVGGRTWDLNQNTAAALGFSGVATVWDSY